jgi:hypothetical protein
LLWAGNNLYALTVANYICRLLAMFDGVDRQIKNIGVSDYNVEALLFVFEGIPRFFG